MADNTDTTRPGEAEAVEVARRALGHIELDSYEGGIVTVRLDQASAAAVAVAYPVIAAAVREQAAQDIEAMDEPYWDTDGAEVGWSWAQDAAARVARGGR